MMFMAYFSLFLPLLEVCVTFLSLNFLTATEIAVSFSEEGVKIQGVEI